jgi:hypothetical protein
MFALLTLLLEEGDAWGAAPAAAEAVRLPAGATVPALPVRHCTWAGAYILG